MALVNIGTRGSRRFPKQFAKDLLEQGRKILAGEVTHWLSFWRARRSDGFSDFVVEWDRGKNRWECRLTTTAAYSLPSLSNYRFA